MTSNKWAFGPIELLIPNTSKVCTRLTECDYCEGPESKSNLWICMFCMMVSCATCRTMGRTVGRSSLCSNCSTLQSIERYCQEFTCVEKTTANDCSKHP